MLRRIADRVTSRKKLRKRKNLLRQLEREEGSNKATGLSIHLRYELSVLDKNGHDNVHAEGTVGEKACPVTVDTGASLIIATPDIGGTGSTAVHRAEARTPVQPSKKKGECL
jgi:hypothetical protein